MFEQLVVGGKVELFKKEQAYKRERRNKRNACKPDNGYQ